MPSCSDIKQTKTFRFQFLHPSHTGTCITSVITKQASLDNKSLDFGHGGEASATYLHLHLFICQHPSKSNGPSQLISKSNNPWQLPSKSNGPSQLISKSNNPGQLPSKSNGPRQLPSKSNGPRQLLSKSNGPRQLPSKYNGSRQHP